MERAFEGWDRSGVQDLKENGDSVTLISMYILPRVYGQERVRFLISIIRILCAVLRPHGYVGVGTHTGRGAHAGRKSVGLEFSADQRIRRSV